MPADGGGKRLEPHGLVMDRAKPFIEGNVGKTRQHLFQRGLHVFLPEEFGIGETGAQNALVASKDHGVAFGIGKAVPDDHEARLQRATGVLSHKIFLVCTDRSLQHLAGKRHETLLDRPEQRRRPFDKAANLVDQPLIRAQRRTGSFGKRGRALKQGGAALVTVDHHVTGAKPFNIIIGAGDTGEVDVIRMFEIMAAAGGGEGKARPAEIEFPGKRSAAEKHIHPVKRAHPAETCGAPALAFRPGEVGQHGCDHAGQQIGRGGARFLDAREQEPAFRRVFLGQLFTRQPGGFQETGNRLLGRVGARAAALFGQVLLPFGKALDIKRQMPRRDEVPGRAMLQPGLAKLAGDQPFQIGCGARLHARRNFLADDFDQQVGHQFASPAFAAPIHASQHPRASARTRPI